MNERTALKYISLRQWLAICRRILDGETITYKFHEGPPRPDENYLAGTHFLPQKHSEQTWFVGPHPRSAAYREARRRDEEQRQKRADARRRRKELGPQLPQPELSARNREIYAARLAGENVRRLGERFKISRSRVEQICHREAEKELRRRRRLYPRAHLARLIDLGGPRDTWLTFMPGGDPRDP